MTRRRALIAAAIAIVVVAAGVFLLRRPGPEPAPAAAAPSVPLVTVRRGDFATRVVAQGRVGPPAGSTARVAFAEPGVLASVDVRVGETVRSGTMLARLDRRALAAALAQAQADAAAAAGQYAGGSVPRTAVRSAQAKLALATARLTMLERGGPAAQSDEIAARGTLRQAELKVANDRATVQRDQILVNGGVVASNELRNAETQLAADRADERSARAKVAASAVGFQAALAQSRADRAAAQNELQTAQAQTHVLQAQTGSAQARLQGAQIAFDQGILRAPSDGVVVAILKHPGEYVDPSAAVVEVGPGAADAITLSVPSGTARGIHVGDPVRIAREQSGTTSEARVSAVVPAIDPTTQSATVTLGGVHDGVPGDAVTATIVTGHLHGLIVPSSAIVEDPQTGTTVVFVRNSDGTFSSHEVTVRASDASDALVTGGVQAGQRIAAQGAYELLAPPG